VALITGANHGIGEATARAFAEQGTAVFATYFRPACRYTPEELAAARQAGTGGPLLYAARQQQTADFLVRDIQQAGGAAAAMEADLARPESVPALFDGCEAALGPVDILVNNHTHCAHDTFDPGAVTGEGFGVDFVSSGIMNDHFAVNARSYALMMAEYIRRHRERGASWGRIVNISTDAAHAHAGSVSYAATKHAIESYSRSAAIEAGKYGITVNIVAAGPVQTGWLTPEQEASIDSATPLRRCGMPPDIADAIVLLASRQAHWLTGQLLYAGGGWRMQQ
jgi:3-oxoacyl-[acyl-carrier protein] reductase